MNFPLRTAFTVSHRFWVVVFLFSFVSMQILIPASGILAVTAEENTEAEKAGSIGGGGRGCCLK